ncbi:hypothetical protein CHARACLAT_026460 [Characodon lateralis]|uniref:Uncharacterized protein n=1 Tax=Characodon lateralis TaxID=208331 RepID=A0ABU7CUI5_9TELE|nr:hypothetical protein [Characodon lateralis]
MQPSLFDDHHIVHIGGQDGRSRFPTGRDTTLFPSLSPVQEPADGILGLRAAFSMLVNKAEWKRCNREDPRALWLSQKRT